MIKYNIYIYSNNGCYSYTFGSYIVGIYRVWKLIAVDLVLTFFQKSEKQCLKLACKSAKQIYILHVLYI